MKGATLAPRVVANLLQVWQTYMRGTLPHFAPGQERHAVPVPRLRGRAAGSRTEGEAQLRAGATREGHRDVRSGRAETLKQFSRLSKLPLQTFYPPTMRAPGAESAALLHRKPLGPNCNGAGCLTQPPLMLTTNEGPSSRVAPKQVLTVCHLPRFLPRCRRAHVLARVLRVLAIPSPGMPSLLQLPTPVPCGRVRT